MMQCKRCKTALPKEELLERFRAGVGHCPNPDCPKVDWALTEKYGRVVRLEAEFEEKEDECLITPVRN